MYILFHIKEFNILTGILIEKLSHSFKHHGDSETITSLSVIILCPIINVYSFSKDQINSMPKYPDNHFYSLKSIREKVKNRVNKCGCVLKSLQSCLTLCTIIDCSLPGSSVHGILQARILEWVAMLSSRGSS